jgi:hypothetical protein
MKTYRGFRAETGTAIVEVDGRPLDLRLDLDNHSPTGFEWGYGGSGPAQLALALLADATGDDDRARTAHQRFKGEYVSRLARNERWEITDQDVRIIVGALQ